MEPVLDEQQSLLRESAVRLARERGGPKRARALRDAGLEMDREAWAKVIEAGWLGIAAPDEAGGLGMGLYELALAAEECGRQLLAVPVAEAAAAAWAIARVDAKPAVLEAVLSGAKLAVPALAQPGWRDAQPLSLADGRVTGKVQAVPYAPSADALLVLAGDALAVVERNAKGVSLATRVNVDGTTSSDVQLEGAPADVVARGAKARELAGRVQELLTLATSAQLVGLTDEALRMTLEFLKVRQQFGKPLGSFQALQHRAADCYVDIELNRSLVYRVCSAWDAGQYHPAMVAATKARTTRCARDITRHTLQLHGAIGYTDEHDIGLYYKRGVVLEALYGNESNHLSGFSQLTLA